MKAIVLKCKAGSRFHFGEYAPDSDTALARSSSFMHSDTLYSAMLNICEDVFGNANDLAIAFNNDQISVSSAFFCIEKANNEYVWFLPKPVSFNAFSFNDQFRKRQKGIEFISAKLWQSLDKPKDLEDRTDLIFIQDLFVCLKSELETNEDFKVFHEGITTKVQVRSPKKEDNLYQLKAIEIADLSSTDANLKVHYFFLLNDEKLSGELKIKLKTVLDVFVHHGAGGERSQYGHFEGFEEKDWSEITIPSEKYCLLSLFSPEKDDMGKLVDFSTLFRGGRRIGSNPEEETDAHGKPSDRKPVYLKTLRMVEEGGVTNGKVSGNIADISPDDSKRFFRYGKPFLLPVKDSWIK